jgi:hypothetical protein
LIIGWREHAASRAAGRLGRAQCRGARRRRRCSLIRRASGALLRRSAAALVPDTLGDRPDLDLLHADFELGSTNAAVAFVAMVLVRQQPSVLRLHASISGSTGSESLREVERNADASRRALDALLATHPRLAERLRDFEKRALSGPAAGLRSVLAIGAHARATRRAVRRELRAERASIRRAGANARAVEAALEAHVAAVRRLAEFSFYERVLSLWHAMHLCVLFRRARSPVAVHLY